MWNNFSEFSIWKKSFPLGNGLIFDNNITKKINIEYREHCQCFSNGIVVGFKLKSFFKNSNNSCEYIYYTVILFATKLAITFIRAHPFKPNLDFNKWATLGKRCTSSLFGRRLTINRLWTDCIFGRSTFQITASVINITLDGNFVLKRTRGISMVFWYFKRLITLKHSKTYLEELAAIDGSEPNHCFALDFELKLPTKRLWHTANSMYRPLYCNFLYWIKLKKKSLNRCGWKLRMNCALKWVDTV